MKHFLLSVLFCCCLFSATAQNSGIAFTYYQSMIFVRMKVNGKGPFLFLLNTSANRSVIDSALAVRLQLATVGRDSVEGTAGKVQVALVKAAHLQLGNAIGKDMIITQRNLKYSFIPCPSYLHGILGTDFLRRYNLSLNFRTKRMQLLTTYKAPRNSMAIHFEWQDNTPGFAVRLNDTFATILRYNSGVSMKTDKVVYINLSPDTWSLLNTTLKAGSPQRYLTGNGVGGGVYLPMYPLPGLRMDELRIDGLNAVVQPREGYFRRKDATGFFGNNLLEKYTEVVLDFPGQSLILPKVQARGKATVAR